MLVCLITVFFCKIVIECKFLVTKSFSITIGEKILIFLLKKNIYNSYAKKLFFYIYTLAIATKI